MAKDIKSIESTRIFQIINPLIKDLPSCLELTNDFCDPSKFSGKLVVDGTYLAVKGYENKLALIWGFDYDSHDCPNSLLAPSESYVSYHKYFSGLKSIKYPLKYLVCDGNEGIKLAARDVFPNVVIQTCLKHFLTSIRTDLAINFRNKNSPYQEFFRIVYALIFSKRLCEIEIMWEIAKIQNTKQYVADSKEYSWLTVISNNIKELTNYHTFENCPRTTNLIEGFNSHLKDRTDRIRGFKSFHSAKYWLNAYVLKRRLTEFEACGKNFKHLNGKTPISNTLKDSKQLPDILG